MIRGLYSAASGMDVQQAKVESVSNNLANATTPGYKKEKVQVGSFPEFLLIQQGGARRRGGPPLPTSSRQVGAMGTGAMVSGLSIDHTPGNVQETSRSADIMLEGPGFLAINVPAAGDPGRVGYTRAGNFKVDSEGYLTVNGYRVLGQSGLIRVGSTPFTAGPDGTIEVNGTTVDRLRLTEFADPGSLRKEGEGIFLDLRGEGRPASSTTVRQGFLEGSNVSVVDEMVDLVAVMRTYEANQRLVQAHDEILSKAVNQVGSVR